MKKLLSLLVVGVSVVGCAHIDRQAAMAATTYDVMSDAEIARAAISEAVGELHEVKQIDAEGVVVQGQAAFISREERLAYERRVDSLVRAKIYGQGTTLMLLSKRCEELQRAGWEAWPKDDGARRLACDFSDGVTLHSLFKKPALQRTFVQLMLDSAADPILAGQVKRKLVRLERTGVEPYLFIVERWERVEGFRPRG